MQRVLRFPLDFVPGPFTWFEWLLLPFVLVAHLVLGFPYFLYGVLTIPSRRMNRFHAEHERQQRRVWEQREGMCHRGRLIEGESLVRLIERGEGCFLRDRHTGQHWWVDAEPASFSPLSSNSPPLENPHAYGQTLYRDLLDEAHGRAVLLDIPNSSAGRELEERIPFDRSLNIADSPFSDQEPSLFCYAHATEEELARLFPESESNDATGLQPELKPFWLKYWKRIGIGYMALLVLVILPLLLLRAWLSLADWLAIGGLWMLADFCLAQLLMAWETRGDFLMQQERSWWRPIFRWVIPSFSILYLYGMGLALCYEAGCAERYLLAKTSHLAAYTLWRWLMPRWYDPFAAELDLSAFDEDETSCAISPT